METNKDILDQPTTYSGTTSSRSITKGEETMRVNHNDTNNGITLKFKGQKFITSNHEETVKLLEKIEVACWGSSSYTEYL